MRVIHFAHNIDDGAGRAAYRLHKGLQLKGIESKILVYKKTGQDDSVIQICDGHLSNPASPVKSNQDILKRSREFVRLIFKLISWKLKIHRYKPKTFFNLNLAYLNFNKVKKYLTGVDVICLHSTHFFLSSRLIHDMQKMSKAKIVWTLMDIEPLTGGCHFNQGCEAFSQACGNCPQLVERAEEDISRKIWEQKAKDLKDLPITFVAVNTWSEKLIAKSSLFGQKRIEKIFLGVDDNFSKKVEKQTARRILNLPQDSKIILFGCFSLKDERKGAIYLKQALKILSDKLNSDDKPITLVTFGRQEGFSFEGIPFKWIHLGELKDDRLISLSFSAADVFASLSIDDLGPLVVNEAFASGLPVAAFDLGVAPDLIKSNESGYIAKKGDINDLAQGLAKLLTARGEAAVSEETKMLRESCKLNFQAEKYQALFKDIIYKK